MKSQGNATIKYDVAADELVIEKRTDWVKLLPEDLYAKWGVTEARKEKAEQCSRSMSGTRLEHAAESDVRKGNVREPADFIVNTGSQM